MVRAKLISPEMIRQIELDRDFFHRLIERYALYSGINVRQRLPQTCNVFRVGFRRWWWWPKVVALQVHDHTLSLGELRAAVEYDDAVDDCAFDCHSVLRELR